MKATPTPGWEMDLMKRKKCRSKSSIILKMKKKANALNAMLDLEEADDRQAGEAIQLQLAAFNAFGKAKGKGKGFGKKGVKGKGKGKVVRSQMSIEQRRAKLRDLKAKSKCLRCGGMGHWAGDPGCKFANKPQPPKPTANLAYESESSDDEEGFFLCRCSHVYRADQCCHDGISIRSIR